MNINLNKKMGIAENELRFMAIYENSSIGIPITDTAGNFIHTNLFFRKLIGYSIDELMGMNISDITHHNDIDVTKKKLTELLSGAIKSFDINKSYICKNGKTIFCNTVVIAPLGPDGNPLFIAAMIKDISELKNQELKLIRARINAEELERERISRDLHDGLGQKIAATSMFLNALDIKLGDVISKDDLHLISKARQLIKEAIVETRNVSHNFMPRNIKNRGFVSTVKELFENYNELNKNVDFKITCSIKVISYPQQVELGLYRIIQELVTNICRHSQATIATLQITMKKDILTLELSDNGIGFDLSNNKENIGTGLRNINQRIEAIGGWIKITSLLGTGSTFKLSIKRKPKDSLDM